MVRGAAEGRGLDPGQQRVGLAVSLSLTGSSVGLSLLDLPESDVGRAGRASGRCQHSDCIKGWRCGGQGTGVRPGPSAVAAWTLSQMAMQHQPGKAARPPAPAPRPPSGAPRSSPCPWLCLVALVLGLLPGGKPGSLPPPAAQHPSWAWQARLYQPVFLGVGTTPVSVAEPQRPCSLEGVEIKGGSFQLLKEGQALEYVCPAGFYPYPVQARTCRSTGSWSALQTKDQKIVKKAECRGWRAGGVGTASRELEQGGRG